MHAEREDRARRKHQPVEIDGDLIGIEDGDKRDRRETAYERGGREFECDGPSASGASMAFCEMAMTVGAGRQM